MSSLRRLVRDTPYLSRYRVRYVPRLHCWRMFGGHRGHHSWVVMRQSVTHTHENSRARGSYEDTFICVSGLDDIHTEVDLEVHLGHMMMREMYSGIHGDALDCREETHLVEHGDSSPLQQHSSERSHSQ